MKSRFFLPFSIFLIALNLGHVSAQDYVPKFALVDFARIQRQFFRTDLERKEFEKERNGVRQELEEKQVKVKDILQQQQDAQQQLRDATLSETKKQEIANAYKERMGQLESLRREVLEMEARENKRLRDLANQIQRSLTKEIYDVIGQIAEKKELDLVLNRTFGINGVPTVAFSSEKNLEDFTDQVIEELNQNAPPDWTPPEPAPVEGDGAAPAIPAPEE